MPRKKLHRNASCPCGSGKKYKNCCYSKGFDWVEDEEGSIGRSIPVSEELKEVIEEQQQRFIAHFGREPRADENLFFNMPPLEHVELTFRTSRFDFPGISGVLPEWTPQQPYSVVDSRSSLRSLRWARDNSVTMITGFLPPACSV